MASVRLGPAELCSGLRRLRIQAASPRTLRLVVSTQRATPVVVSTNGRRMMGVLASLLDAANDRLRALCPALSPRGEAV